MTQLSARFCSIPSASALLAACGSPERLNQRYRGIINLPYDEVFDAGVRLIQETGNTIDFCDKDNGIVSGHYTEFGVDLGIGLLAFIIPYVELRESPRQNYYTSRIRALGPNRTEFSSVRISYAGSSEPRLSTGEIVAAIERIAAEHRAERAALESAR